MEGSEFGGRGGKKWLSRASFIWVGVEAPGSEGKRGGGFAHGYLLDGPNRTGGRRKQQGPPVGGFRGFVMTFFYY